MAQEGSYAPKCRDISPTFHERFVSRVKGIFNLAFKGAVLLDVYDATVAIPVKRQLGLAKIGPVEILRLDEGDYQGVW